MKRPEPIPLNLHRVEPTADGRFAVVSPEGETLTECVDEGAAQQWAAALNQGPVESVNTRGRWEAKAA